MRLLPATFNLTQGDFVLRAALHRGYWLLPTEASCVTGYTVRVTLLLARITLTKRERDTYQVFLLLHSAKNKT